MESGRDAHTDRTDRIEEAREFLLGEGLSPADADAFIGQYFSSISLGFQTAPQILAHLRVDPGGAWGFSSTAAIQETATAPTLAAEAAPKQRHADYTRTGEKGRGADPWEHFARAGVEAAWFTWPEQQLLRTVYQVHTMREGWHKLDRRDRDTRAGIALEPGKLCDHYARKFGRRCRKDKEGRFTGDSEEGLGQ